MEMFKALAMHRRSGMGECHVVHVVIRRREPKWLVESLKGKGGFDVDRRLRRASACGEMISPDIRTEGRVVPAWTRRQARRNRCDQNGSEVRHGVAQSTKWLDQADESIFNTPGEKKAVQACILTLVGDDVFSICLS